VFARQGRPSVRTPPSSPQVTMPPRWLVSVVAASCLTADRPQRRRAVERSWVGMQTTGNNGVCPVSATSGARCDRYLGRRAVWPLLNVERQRTGQDTGQLVHAGHTRSRPRTSPPRSPHVIVGGVGSATSASASLQAPRDVMAHRPGRAARTGHPAMPRSRRAPRAARARWPPSAGGRAARRRPGVSPRAARCPCRCSSGACQQVATQRHEMA
jgi:hypothetical protein